MKEGGWAQGKGCVERRRKVPRMERQKKKQARGSAYKKKKGPKNKRSRKRRKERRKEARTRAYGKEKAWHTEGKRGI